MFHHIRYVDMFGYSWIQLVHRPHCGASSPLLGSDMLQVHPRGSAPGPPLVVACSGEMRLVNLDDFVKEILPENITVEFPQRLDSSTPSLVCILCHADFDKDASLQDLQHWVPGWAIEDVPGASQMSEKWLQEKEDLEQARLVALNQQMEQEMDEELRHSLEYEAARCEQRLSNFVEMVQILGVEHGLFFREVCRDGNCGVEMVAQLEQPPGSGTDVAELLPVLRQELKECWENATALQSWRVIFDRFSLQGGGQPDDVQVEESEVSNSQVTPPKKTSKAECPFTPDPVEKGGKLFPTQPAANGVLVIPGDGGDPPAKKRRTGKASAIETKINNEKYVAQHLAEKGVTYRGWLTVHKRHMVIVWLV